MNEKQLADTMREWAKRVSMIWNLREEIEATADVLDPPKPDQGTVVSWRFIGAWAYHGWRYGVVDKSLKGIWTSDGLVYWDRIEWKPARILGPRQVAVNVQPVSDWPTKARELVLAWKAAGKGIWEVPGSLVMTRSKAERMETDNE